MILSIIVPVYNVAPFLEKCVWSLLAQDLTPDDYEIILVDDGSTDGGGELCERLKDECRTIRVIHQPNQGLSAARNTGLSVAQGEYVLFVDSDDWIESNVLGGLARMMEEDRLDVLRFGYRRVAESGEEVEWCVRTGRAGAEDVQTGKQFLLNHLWYSCYAWQFMLKRVFLTENGLFFKPGIIFEDTQWTPRVMEVAGRVRGVETLVYNYLERTGSITKGKARKTVDGQFLLIDEMNEQMAKVDDKRWYQGMLAQLAVAIVSTLAIELYDVRRPYLNRLREKEIRPLSTYLAGKKARRKIFLINLSPEVACRFIHLANR